MSARPSLLLFVRRGLRQHLLTSVLAALLVALATAGFVTVWTVRREAQRAFTSGAGEFDAVLGARGSPHCRRWPPSASGFRRSPPSCGPCSAARCSR